MLISHIAVVIAILLWFITSYRTITHRQILSLVTGLGITNILFYNILIYQSINTRDSLISSGISLVMYIILNCIRYHLTKPMSKEKRDNAIVGFTNRANPNNPLCIMAGDLSFFVEDVSSNDSKQFAQLKEMEFKEIHIIAKKPLSFSEEEKIRLGCIYYSLNLKYNGLKIKYYNESYPDSKLRFRKIVTGSGGKLILHMIKDTDGPKRQLLLKLRHQNTHLNSSHILDELKQGDSDPRARKLFYTVNKIWNLYWNQLEEIDIGEYIQAYKIFKGLP